MVVLNHLLDVDGGLHAVVHRRVGEDGLVVEQVALGVETDDFATRAETGVDTHDALLTQGCREQQLAQVLGKDADGFFVGLFLAQIEELRFNRGLQQTLVAVLDGLGHQTATGCLSVDVVALQTFHALIVAHGVDAQAQNALGLTSPHRQESVAGTALQGFVPVKVVAEFLCFVRILFSLHHFRGDDCRPAESSAHLLARAFVLADLFGNDVLGTFEGGSDVRNIAHNKALGGAFGIAFALLQQDDGQRLQAHFAGYLGSCAALGTIGQVDVLQRGCLPRIVDALLEFGCHLTLFGDGLHDGLLALLQFLQSFVLVADGAYLYLVEPSRALLAVAGNEGNGAAFVNQGEGSIDVFR